MHEIVWEQRFETGIDRIDLQHRCFVGLINELAQLAAQPGVDRDHVLAKLHELYLYTAYHFCSEELVMRQLGYPGLDDHRRVHEILLTGLNGKIREARFADLHVDEIVRFLFMWFAGHTVDDDRNIADWMGGKEPA